MTLYAICKPKSGFAIKRILLSSPAQTKVANYFDQQLATFMDGVDHEVEFDGDWKPDADEILSIDAPPEAAQLLSAVTKSATAIPSIDADALEQEFIKALFVKRKNGTVLIQAFTTQQLLMRRHAFLLDKDTFKEMESPAFVISNNLAAVLDGQNLKFKNFPAVKRFFDLKVLYEEATDAQIESFCSHTKLEVADVDAIKAAAGPALRKRIHAISQTGVLDAYSIKQLSNRAAKLKIPLPMSNGKISMPSNKGDLKKLLSFFEEKVYQGALTQQLYVANAKRLYKP